MSELALIYRSRGIELARLIAQGFLAYWPILALPCIALLLSEGVFALYPQLLHLTLMSIIKDFFITNLPFGILLIVIARAISHVFHLHDNHLVPALRKDLASATRRPIYLINALPIMLAMLLFSKAMLEFKPEIPLINGFHWDETFSQFDRLLHFGVDPWRIIHPLMGHAVITILSNVAYNLWILIFTSIWVWVSFRSQPNEIHSRFVIAFMLVWWFGGCVLATIFSSAGPAFYNKLGLASANPYADLMSYLNSTDGYFKVWALQTQNNLWDSYNGNLPATGISAFPSMHNASAALFVLMFYSVSKAWGRFFLAYAVLIFLTSIHLGWHYAVDGYAGMLVACLCWKAAAPLARYMHNQPAMKRFEEGLAAEA